jgi:hypothetical protein
MSPSERNPKKPESPADSPRGRTLSHLRRIMKSTAAAALAAGACEACPMVCDPLPPPLDCKADGGLNLSWRVSAISNWEPGDAGLGAQVAVSVMLAPTDDLRSAQDPVVTGGSLVSATQTVRGVWVLFCQPGDGGTMQIELTFDCAGKTQTVRLILSVGGPRTPGASIPVQIVS